MNIEYSKKIIFCGILTAVVAITALSFPLNCEAGEGAELFSAIEANDVANVRALIEKGAKLDSRNDNNDTALMVAAFYGYADIVKLLLEKGADVNARGAGGVTALMCSAVNTLNDVVTARILVEKGADVNAKDENGNTPVMIARNKGNGDVAAYLESSGASGGVNMTLLYSLAGFAGILVLGIIVKNAVPMLKKNGKDAGKNTPSRKTAANENPQAAGQEKAVEKPKAPEKKSQYIDDSADAKKTEAKPPEPEEENAAEKKKDYSKYNVIELIGKGNIGLVREMIESGVIKAGQADKSGWTLLMEAANKGNIEMVRLLVESGAEINSKDRDGKTALINASYWQHLDIIQYLVSNKANIDIKGADGRSALEVARDKGNDKTVKLLLSLGARDDSGKEEPSETEPPAEEGQSEELKADLLQQMLSKIVENDIDALNSLIQSGVDVNYRDKNGITPLMLASGHGLVEVVKFLIKNGADVNSVSARGGTPLILAAGRGHGEIVVLLIKNGADVNLKASNGATALMFAEKNGHEKIAAVLRRVGALE